MREPLVIVSGLRAKEAERVAPLLREWNRPVFAEGTSRLRGRLGENEIRGGERVLRRLKFDGVIRVGTVPTLRYWRDLENSGVDVRNFTAQRFSGLARASATAPFDALAELRSFTAWSSEERALDREHARSRADLFQEFPLSEPAWVERVSGWMPENARVFLGNSLPIREWDFASRLNAPTDVFANRGANGIDGLVSTFCGLSSPGLSNWALLGDLSVMYDLSGPWALRPRPIEDWNLVVINNGGGQIFNRMFRHPLFLNSHDMNFESWAKMWSLRYERMERVGTLEVAKGPRVIEVRPSAEQTENFWQAWERA
ncbi:MAG TPA: hypothetical protein PKC28_10980 [Bdellovibrionales bacterium]|nr:hypothetical protein [Bdellovibrionales bacterium]